MTRVIFLTCDWCGEEEREEDCPAYKWERIVFPNPPGGSRDFCSKECEDKWWAKAFRDPDKE